MDRTDTQREPRSGLRQWAAAAVVTALAGVGVFGVAGAVADTGSGSSTTAPAAQEQPAAQQPQGGSAIQAQSQERDGARDGDCPKGERGDRGSGGQGGSGGTSTTTAAPVDPGTF